MTEPSLKDYVGKWVAVRLRVGNWKNTVNGTLRGYNMSFLVLLDEHGRTRYVPRYQASEITDGFTVLKLRRGA